jgi:hypothetical protein
MVRYDADIEEIIDALEHDVGEHVVNVERYGQNRLRIAGTNRGPAVYPERILEWMALAGWHAERTRKKTLSGTEYPVVEFVRGEEFVELERHRAQEFEKLNI